MKENEQNTQAGVLQIFTFKPLINKDDDYSGIAFGKKINANFEDIENSSIPVVEISHLDEIEYDDFETRIYSCKNSYGIIRRIHVVKITAEDILPNSNLNPASKQAIIEELIDIAYLDKETTEFENLKERIHRQAIDKYLNDPYFVLPYQHTEEGIKNQIEEYARRFLNDPLSLRDGWDVRFVKVIKTDGPGIQVKVKIKDPNLQLSRIVRESDYEKPEIDSFLFDMLLSPNKSQMVMMNDFPTDEAFHILKDFVEGNFGEEE
jgi:hypothetical protein